MTNIVYEPSETAHWKNLFPSKTMLLGSHNLNPGEEIIATIKSVETKGKIKSQTGKDEIVPIMHFQNSEKIPPMVLNKTNTQTIASLYGDRYTDWYGKDIQLYSQKIKAFGKNVTALRVRNIIPNSNIDVGNYEKGIDKCKTLDELKEYFMNIPKHIRRKVEDIKDIKKEELTKNENT